MKLTDTRVQFTKARFRAALTSLLEEKPIGSVTVKELCERAGLNRGTYYLHYAEPIDILREEEDALLDAAQEALALEPEGGMRASFLHLLAAMEQDRAAYRAVLGRNGDPTFIRRIRENDFEILRFPATESLIAAVPPQFVGAVLDFICTGCLGVIGSWLESPDSLSREQVAETLSALVKSVFYTAKQL